MKFYTEIVMQMTDKIGEYILVSEKSFEYNGPVAFCVRGAVSTENQLAKEAETAAGEYGGEAATAGAQLMPFYSQEMRAQHSMDPTQIGEQLTMMGAGTGGALGAEEGMATEEAARTRNASGFAKTLDEAARAREKAAAGMAEGVAGKDVAGALALRQAGAAGMAGERGEDINAQLKAMGQSAEDTMNAVQASQTGWFQNLQQGMNMVNQTASSFLCPAFGTKYHLSDGTEKPVEFLKIGEELKGIDGEPQKIKIIQSAITSVLKLTFDDGHTLRCSKVHAMALPKGGFTVAAYSLGKTVLTETGESKIVNIEPDGKDIVFSVVTDGSHTYLAGGVWSLGAGDGEVTRVDEWDKVGEELAMTARKGA
jgi:hypothetical protein